MVLTPHPGEFARLTGRTVAEIQADREGHAAALAQADHLVRPPQGRQYRRHRRPPHYVNTTGNPGMATGGAGDVLTGVIAALHRPETPGLRSRTARRLCAWPGRRHRPRPERRDQLDRRRPRGFAARRVLPPLFVIEEGRSEMDEPRTQSWMTRRTGNSILSTATGATCPSCSRAKYGAWVVCTAEGVQHEGESQAAMYEWCKQQGLKSGDYVVGRVLPDQPTAEVPADWLGR